MDTTSYYIMNSPLADWVLAICTFFGVLIAGFALSYAKKAYKKDRSETQLQIEKITEQIGLYSKLLELERTKRKSSIRPIFLRSSDDSDSNLHNIGLFNEGKMAYNVDINEIHNDRLNLINFNKHDYVNSGQGITISFMKKNSNDATAIHIIPFEIELVYENEDGDKFKQKVFCENGKGFKIGRQEEII